MKPHDPASDLVRELISRSFDGLITDTTRAQTLLKDAIPQIHQSFMTVQQQLRSQVGRLESLGRQLNGTEEKEGFIATMRVMVDTFVQDLIHVSKQSLKIVDGVAAMTHDVDEVMRNVVEIEEMARTTRFIALNAHIEAHRSGEAGKNFRVVADEVKRLAGDANDFSGQIRGVVDRCRGRLGQTRELVAALASRDMTGALQAQNELLQMMDQLQAGNGTLLASLNGFEEAVSMAMRALQFEDIMSQLLAGIRERLQCLQGVWLESLDMRPEERIEIFSRHTTTLERRTVTQGSVEAGTAELF